MLPGPNQIIACPHCRGLSKNSTLMSGNTFGARVWTDGKQIAPMLPKSPLVVKCIHCSDFYWLAEGKVVGTQSWDDQEVNPAWKTLDWPQELTEEEFYLSIDKSMALNLIQERTLRVLAWWRRNDDFRDIPPEQKSIIPNTEACKKNLQALARLLEEGDENDCLMRAEVHRELGDFISAKQILATISSAKFTAVAFQLRTLCDSGDTCVRELHFDD